jgi:predicted site-specific integrase-resolvase
MRKYATNTKAMMTLADAARELEISRQTLIKWADLGYAQLTTIGPPERPIRRMKRDEVERLKKAS